MPIVIALCAAAYSVNGLLFTNLDGTPIIALLTFGTIFQITMMTTNSILLGVGKPRITMISVAAGVVIKLIASLILAPIFGIYGIIIATALCFLVITYLNLRVLRKIVDFSIMGDRWKGFIITVLLAAGVGFATNWIGEYDLWTVPASACILLAYLPCGWFACCGGVSGSHGCAACTAQGRAGQLPSHSAKNSSSTYASSTWSWAKRLNMQGASSMLQYFVKIGYKLCLLLKRTGLFV